MDTISRGRHALAIALVGAFATPVYADDGSAHIVVYHGQALQMDHGETLHVSGDKPVGIYLYPRASMDADTLTLIHDGKAGYGYGILAYDGAEANLDRSRIAVRGRSVIGILAQPGAMVELRDSLVELSPEVNGHATALALAGGKVTLRGTTVEATKGHAISAHFTGDETSHVVLDNATIRGRIGNGPAGLDIVSVDSRIEGDIVSDGDGMLDLRMQGGLWRGRAGHLSAASLEDSQWVVTGDSDVAGLRLQRGGGIGFDRTARGFRTLRVGDWESYAGAAGITFGTRLDAGGSLERQGTDRLLITGDAAGVTSVRIDPTGGTGAATAGDDGVNGADDGITLVQVGGKASADSFRLAGDYVAVGPWQYRLHAYEPGQSDPRQRLLEGAGGNYWDFRLQSTRVGSVESEARATLVPQAPVYLVLTHALFGYGMAALDAMRPVDAESARDPAWRVRAFGGSIAYRSSLPFAAYGFNYTRHDRGIQVANDFLVHAHGDTTLRAGAVVSVGGTRVIPRAMDGRGDARIDSRALAIHAALTTGSDWHVTSSYAIAHHRVNVHTPMRGEVLGRLRANAHEAVLSAAYRWQAAARLRIEPGMSATWQRLRFSRAADRDGVDVRIGASERTTLRTGARAELAFMPKGNVLYAWSPYVGVHYSAAHDAGASVRLSGERFATGRSARSVDLSTGARFHLWTRVTAYVDVTSRMRAGKHGESGVSARTGAVLTF